MSATEHTPAPQGPEPTDFRIDTGEMPPIDAPAVIPPEGQRDTDYFPPKQKGNRNRALMIGGSVVTGIAALGAAFTLGRGTTEAPSGESVAAPVAAEAPAETTPVQENSTTTESSTTESNPSEETAEAPASTAETGANTIEVGGVNYELPTEGTPEEIATQLFDLMNQALYYGHVGPTVDRPDAPDVRSYLFASPDVYPFNNLAILDETAEILGNNTEDYARGLDGPLGYEVRGVEAVYEDPSGSAFAVNIDLEMTVVMADAAVKLLQETETPRPTEQQVYDLLIDGYKRAASDSGPSIQDVVNQIGVRETASLVIQRNENGHYVFTNPA